MSVLVPRIPLHVVTDLINEWSSVPQQVSLKPWTGYPSRESPFRTQFEQAWGAEAPTVTDQEIVSAGDRLYPVFAEYGRSAGTDQLNSVLDELRPHPTIPTDARAAGFEWRVARDEDRLLAALTIPIATLFAENRSPRIGICQAGNCADVFVDSSARRNRCFCSTRCQTRQRVRAFRDQEHESRWRGVPPPPL